MKNESDKAKIMIIIQGPLQSIQKKSEKIFFNKKKQNSRACENSLEAIMILNCKKSRKDLLPENQMIKEKRKNKDIAPNQPTTIPLFPLTFITERMTKPKM